MTITNNFPLLITNLQEIKLGSFRAKRFEAKKVHLVPMALCKISSISSHCYYHRKYLFIVYILSLAGKSESGPVKPARRHSFNSCKSATTTTAAESGDSHYEADGESSHSCNNSNRTNANNDNSSYSDSEAGTKAIQVQARIKSLWGSFRKKRPMHDPVIVRGPVRAAPTVHTTNSSLYSCFGGTENGSNPVDSSASSSYHTPGSPAKQQSDSSSSLSR